jgi:phosphoribosylformimino-5-aminoimidazole carboxamide ribotide isomerase
VLFSLDLDDGLPRMAAPDAWAARRPDELARRAIDLGVRHLLLLDLSRVGTGRGPGTEALMESIRRHNPHVTLTVGGGISTIDEVRSLLRAGAARVLIGSALHDGRIGPSDLARLIAD